jgi:hypothetical protein
MPDNDLHTAPDGADAVAGEATRAKARRPIDILRDRLGGASESTKESFKEQNRVRKLLNEALREKPRTVPELAVACALPSEEVMWHLMALRRYGKVVEQEVRGDYYVYRLKEV